jgi:hypothetical protein
MANRKVVIKKVVKPVPVITGKLASFKKLKVPVLKATGIVKKKTGSKRGARLLLSEKQTEQLKKMYNSGKYSEKHICEKFKISPPTLYNYLKR